MKDKDIIEKEAWQRQMLAERFQGRSNGNSADSDLMPGPDRKIELLSVEEIMGKVGTGYAWNYEHIQTLLSSLEIKESEREQFSKDLILERMIAQDLEEEIERLKVEIQKYKMFIKNYPSIIGNIIKEAVEELEREAK